MKISCGFYDHLKEIAYTTADDTDNTSFSISEIQTLLSTVEANISEKILQLFENKSSYSNSSPQDSNDINPQINMIGNAITAASREIANIGKKLNNPELKVDDMRTELEVIVQAILNAALGASDIKINSQESNLNINQIKNDIRAVCTEFGIKPPDDINKSETPQ